jgi:threonylcarbamoyladenosine tRNA methylthiotransferase MtaB
MYRFLKKRGVELRFFLKTYGCKVNQYESQLIRERFLSQGHEETDNIENADMCLVNTCTVTAKADRECREILRRITRKNPNAKIIAMGCYVEKDFESIKAINSSIEALDNNEKLKSTLGNSINFFKAHTRAFIKVQDGCNNFCSYCKVPLVRGRSRSRDPEEILKEAKALLDNGYKELVLTGICLGDFGKYSHKDTNLAMLVEKISKIKGDFRIRLSSIELPDVTDELISKMSWSKKLCHHLHMPLQSGDDKILRGMNRKYTISDFISRVEDIRLTIPDIGITTDVIVGFPGETELNFKNTVETVKKIKPSRAHIFTYSPRPGTKAFMLKDDVPAKVKKQRMETLKKITDTLAEEFKKSLARKEQKVLVEHARDRRTAKLCGYTDNYVKVLISGPDTSMGNFVSYKRDI